jgi:hypothetical protein
VNPLDAALANLDRVFTGMRDNPEFGGCERCYSADDLAALRGPDDLPDELVLRVLLGWDHRWINKSALLHRVTPQFLRLLVRGQVDSGAYNDVAELLWDAGWTTWPEHDAVRAVLMAWWRDSLDYPKLQLLIPASHEVMPWVREFECDPAALPDLIEEWCHDLLWGELGFDTAEVIDWLFNQGLDLLTRLPDPDPAVSRLADLEYWLQTLERPPK